VWGGASRLRPPFQSVPPVVLDSKLCHWWCPISVYYFTFFYLFIIFQFDEWGTIFLSPLGLEKLEGSWLQGASLPCPLNRGSIPVERFLYHSCLCVCKRLLTYNSIGSVPKKLSWCTNCFRQRNLAMFYSIPLSSP